MPRIARQSSPVSERSLASISHRSASPSWPSLKRAQLDQLDDLPLAQLAYPDPGYDPAELCIMRTGDANAPVAREKRSGFNAIFWARDGPAYMLIGRRP